MKNKATELKQFFAEHAIIFVVAAISVISLILVIIVFTLASSGSTGRTLVIDDISGSAFILKSDGQIPADRNMKLSNGDVIITSSDSNVRLKVDKDKYIYIEPDTTLYVNFTETSSKGSIIVNISDGSAICRIDSKLSRREAFEVRTPNAVISASDCVFRTEFEYLEEYGGYSDVKITDLQCVDNEAEVQLYDAAAEPSEQLMLLTENKCARLMTCAETSRYEYLNDLTDLNKLSVNTIKNLIRIAAERPSGYSLSDLNIAYQNKLNNTETTVVSIQTMYPPADESEAPVTTSVPETVLSMTETEPVTVSADTSGTEEITAEETSDTSKPVTSGSRDTSVTTGTKPAATSSSAPVTESSSIPPIRQETTVTPASTEPAVTAPPVTTAIPGTTKPTIPWWEIINSKAYTSSETDSEN